MHYSLYARPAKKISRLFLLLTAVGFGIALALSMFTRANADAPVSYTDVPFTQQEIDDNWFVDRAVPSGGYGSTSYAGRSDVLEINIDSDNRSTAGAFYYTEGLQRELADGVISLRSDVYVESSWLSHDVRTGLWGVGHDSSSDVSAYPIIEFTTAGDGDFTGWRVWDGVNGGWTNMPLVDFNVDEWNQLEIMFNSATGEFDLYVNDEEIASNNGGDSVDFGAVILNSYNYGTDGQDYSVHWSNFGYATDYIAGITSPDADEEITRGDDIDLAAQDIEAADGNVQWALREGTCARGTNTVAGNVDGYNTGYDWENGMFNATVDSSGLDVGEYCFVFNPSDGGRYTQEFMVVYANPTAKDECKKNGYAEFGFRNQGQCIRFVNTDKDSR